MQNNTAIEQPRADLHISSLFLHSRLDRPALRVGLLLDSLELPAWFQSVIGDIQGSDFARVVCLALNQAATAELRANRTRGWMSKLFRAESRRSILYRLYERLYDSRNRHADDPLRETSCAELLGEIPAIVVEPLGARSVQRFPENAIHALRAQSLDVILRFGFKILRGDVLHCARYGIWSYHHGDSDQYRGMPPCFWEMTESNPISGVVLQVLNEELDRGLVLTRGLFATSSAVSVSKNRFAPFWCSEHFVIQKLRELHDEGWESVRARASPAGAYSGRKRLYRTPTNLDMLKWTATKLLPASVRKILRPQPVETWQIGIRRSAEPLGTAPTAAALEEFVWSSAPPGHYWADPFVFEWRGQPWVFFEDYDLGTQLGAIGCAPLEPSGALGPARIVIRRDHHLSYPCVFAHEGEVFMVPESSACGRIELLRAHAFPDRWVPERTLVHMRAVDSTPFEHNGRWWMFTNPLIVDGHAAITLLFHADELMGDWKPHPMNPVCSDVRHARGAGHIIHSDGVLFRPAQDCSVGYGYALAFMRIGALDESTYTESHAGQLLPDFLPRQAGVHTYNRHGVWETLDAKFVVNSRQAMRGGSTPDL